WRMGEMPLDLTGADLTGADLSRPVWLSGARMDGAILDKTVLFASNLDAALPARVTSVTVQPPPDRDGQPTSFTGADLEQLRDIGLLPDPWKAARPFTAPSFNCEKAATPTEKTICAHNMLRGLDLAMAKAWQAAGKPAQAKFLSRRNACGGDDGCIAEAYQARLGELLTPPPTGPATYEFKPFALPEALRDQPLARRLAAAIGRHTDAAIVTIGQGTLKIEVISTGSNGHSCTLEHDALRFDARRGVWRDAEDEDTFTGVVVLPTVVVVVDPDRQLCGVRAGWPPAYFR
ncbi:MAG TPA: hypothetical protein VEB64_00745, partial [Azospirillaceae bacterium]|nr:hypothetical protein [Azospirillaceae bacterium]